MSMQVTANQVIVTSLFAIPAIALAAYRGQQRWEAAQRLSPPAVPTEPTIATIKPASTSRWKRLRAFLPGAALFCGIFGINWLRSQLLFDAIWATYMLAYSAFAFYGAGAAFFVQDDWSLEWVDGSKRLVMSNTALSNYWRYGRVVCLALVGMTVVSIYTQSDLMAPLVNVALIVMMLPILPRSIATRAVVMLTIGIQLACVLVLGVLFTIITLFKTPSEESSKPSKPPLKSIWMDAFLGYTAHGMFLAFSSLIVMINLRFDMTQTEDKPQPLAAPGESVQIAPLFPIAFAKLFAARTFRTSFLVLILTFTAAYVACWAIDQEPIIWSLVAFGIAPSVVGPASAAQAYYDGRFAAWWSYKEVWIPEVTNGNADVEGDTSAPAVKFSEKKPLVVDTE